MLNESQGFSSFAVKDLDAAKRFYGETLGQDVRDGPMGVLECAGLQELIHDARIVPLTNTPPPIQTPPPLRSLEAPCAPSAPRFHFEQDVLLEQDLGRQFPPFATQPLHHVLARRPQHVRET